MLLVLACAALSVVARGAPAAQSAWQRYSVLTPAGPVAPSAASFKRIKTLVYAEHRLGKGEWNVWALARDYGTTMSSLQATNNNELLLVSPGTPLTVHNKKGLLYVVRNDVESLDAIIAKYQKDPAKARKLKEKVAEANALPGTALLGSYILAKGETVLLPDVSVDFDTYRFPFQQSGWHRVSSGYGRRFHPILKYTRRHDGWDLPKPYGTPVYPARSGKVVYAGWKEGYGHVVEVRHADGAWTLYGHLSSVAASPGQLVQRGKSLLGRVGNSGLSTGPHIHFEVRDSRGRPLNPRSKIGRR